MSKPSDAGAIIEIVNQINKLNAIKRNVIKEGNQPIKPSTWESVEQKTAISKNYRIAEKDGLFWIEELKIEHYKILGKYIPVGESWIIIDTTIYHSLEQCKSHLNLIIESKLTIKSTETKYHYL
jgi:hypothetical protein